MVRVVRAGLNEPRLREVVQGINVWKGTAGCGHCGPVFACDAWLRSTFVYRGESEEVLRTIPFMFDDFNMKGYMEGDCDDMAIMGAALLTGSGIPSRFTAICSASPLEFDHVFCEARVGTDWIPVDPTVEYGTQYRHFGIMSEAV